MALPGFILVDRDDQTLFQRGLTRLGVPHPAVFFADGQAILDYLYTTNQLIVSEISLTQLNGLKLPQQIEQ